MADDNKKRGDPPGYKCWIGFAPKAKKYYRICKTLEELDAIKKKTAKKMGKKIEKEAPPDMSKAMSKRIMESKDLTNQEKKDILKSVKDKKELVHELKKMAGEDKPKKVIEKDKKVVLKVPKPKPKPKKIKPTRLDFEEDDEEEEEKLPSPRFQTKEPKKVIEKEKKVVLKVSKPKEAEPKSKEEKLKGISGDGRKQKAEDIKLVLETTRGKNAENWVNKELDDRIGPHPYINWEDMKDLARMPWGGVVPSSFWTENKYRRAVRDLIIEEYAKVGIELKKKEKKS